MNLPALDASTVRLVAAALTLGVLVSACGDEGGAATSGPRVVATTGIAADIVGEVAGEDAEVVQLVPDGAAPHDFSPSAQEQAELTGADLLVYFSPALEEALPLEGADRSFAIADHVGDPRAGGEAGDPHVWLDPTLIRNALPDLAAELGMLDPANAAAYERRARRYGRELGALDAEIAELVERVPPADRKLVTSHDLLAYFADRYGFELVGSPFGLSPEAEASAGELAELIERVEAVGVPTVFAQQGDDPEVLRQVADEAGVAVVDDLLVESLDASAPTYVEMMRATAARITEALGG